MAQVSKHNPTARSAATRAVSILARTWPDVQAVEPNTAGLDDRDARLAVAIYRVTVQRWITLEFLLNRFLRRRLNTTPPMVRAAMLTGAAQLLFMDNTAAHAIVDESVRIAKQCSGASAGVVNAVLRKMTELESSRRETGGFVPNPRHVPWRGGVIELRDALLPPIKTLDRYLSVTTSHPYELVTRWIELFGKEEARRLLLHSLKTPPTIVYTNAELGTGNSEPHAERGFAVWHGERDALPAFLAETGGWVQDPVSHRPVAATAGLRPGLIIDYCAGRGTKTRQLARLHPDARIVASDPDAKRYEDLARLFAESSQVQVQPHDTLGSFAGQADLLLLDVPCTNTGVLARRLEARYRYHAASLASVVELQRSIVQAAAPLLRPGGSILYSTCSVEPVENRQQAEWIAAQTSLRLQHEEQTPPDGESVTYHDGGYYALLA